MSHIQDLFSSPLLSVRDHVCTIRRGEQAPTRGGAATHLRLVRRGCFYCHLGSRALLADASTAYICDLRGEYRSSHPCDGGDDCTLFELEPELMAEMFGQRRELEHDGYAVSPSAQLSHLALHGLIKRGGADRLAAQELTLDLLQRIARQGRGGPRPGGARQRVMVDRAKAVLNQHLGCNIDMADVARQAGSSPFHLMRVFRAETGLALRAYRSRLRVCAALERLADGADDLSELALDFGFTSHSHLTSTFQQVLGAPPSAVRARLTRGGLQRLLASAA